jgi:hypothetical protein
VTGYAEPMVGFGYKQAWLAVREAPAAAVTEAMQLRGLGPVQWRSGIDLAYVTDDRLMLTPPLPGAEGAAWTLVVGRWLLQQESTVDIVALSRRLRTEVQFYATYRVQELHQWRRARNGELVRAFGYVGRTGEVTQWYGKPDRAEREAHLPAKADADTVILVDEADVLSVAAAWSLNPTTLDGVPATAPLQAAAAPAA